MSLALNIGQNSSINSEIVSVTEQSRTANETHNAKGPVEQDYSQD